VKTNFCASAPDKLGTADTTNLGTDGGFLYLAFILDVYSRMIMGWRMVDHLRAERVVDALEMAVWRRKPAVGLVHRLDRGAQYAALSFGKRFEEAGIVPSTGRVGSALDNATSESFVAASLTSGFSVGGGAFPAGRRPIWPSSTTSEILQPIGASLFVGPLESLRLRASYGGGGF
jgi:transposase InsO family protein